MNPDNRAFFDLFRTLAKPGQDPATLVLTFDEVEDDTDPEVNRLASALLMLIAHQYILEIDSSSPPTLPNRNFAKSSLVVTRDHDHGHIEGDYKNLLEEITRTKSSAQRAGVKDTVLSTATAHSLQARIPHPQGKPTIFLDWYPTSREPRQGDPNALYLRFQTTSLSGTQLHRLVIRTVALLNEAHYQCFSNTLTPQAGAHAQVIAIFYPPPDLDPKHHKIYRLFEVARPVMGMVKRFIRGEHPELEIHERQLSEW